MYSMMMCILASAMATVNPNLTQTMMGPSPNALAGGEVFVCEEGVVGLGCQHEARSRRLVVREPWSFGSGKFRNGDTMWQRPWNCRLARVVATVSILWPEEDRYRLSSCRAKNEDSEVKQKKRVSDSKFRPIKKKTPLPPQSLGTTLFDVIFCSFGDRTWRLKGVWSVNLGRRWSAFGATPELSSNHSCHGNYLPAPTMTQSVTVIVSALVEVSCYLDWISRMRLYLGGYYDEYSGETFNSLRVRFGVPTRAGLFNIQKSGQRLRPKS
ncbi:hypothetical protein CPB84DRAFT_1828209 [Gymnopilus junonius]|uniref:Uncharacterized protein n=1 Tax=Gymnopilus junonius TaxID=109634 RepID=A0A9P5TIW3_GYMJU|nr:hypothetical protein CPB84DRAFT_1828209 [Gymnopilus junonius]